MASEAVTALPTRPKPVTNLPESVLQNHDESPDHPESDFQIEKASGAPSEDQAAEAGEPGYVDTDDDDDRYRLTVNPSKPRKITEKKLRDHAVLQAWIAKTQREAAKSAIVTLNDPDKQSLTQLIHASENRKISATPREYQIELFEQAKEKNTNVVLPTGIFTSGPLATC